MPLRFSTFLTLFLNVFTWFQLLMDLLKREYLPITVLCFPVLIFRLRSSLLSTVLEVYSLPFSKPSPVYGLKRVHIRAINLRWAKVSQPDSFILFENLAAFFCTRFNPLATNVIYIYGAPSKARNANVVYIWTYVWQR